MADRVTATQDDSLSARVVQSHNLTYSAADLPDVPARLAQGLSASQIVQLVNRLALVQDQANCLVLVDLESHEAWNQSLSPDAEATDLDDVPMDLEACAAVPGSDAQKFVAFGSGAGTSHEWVAIIDWRTPSNPPRVILHEIPEFFQTLRDFKDGFDGTALNVEGTLFVDDDTMRFFFQRTATGTNGERMADAAVDVPWELLELYLRDPTRMPAPPPQNLTHYDFGTLNGQRLLFSDARRLDGGGLLYAATVAGDDPQDTAAVLGRIDDDGIRFTPLLGEDGDVFDGKIEGLSLHPTHDGRIQFVIDAARTGDASRVFEAQLDGF